MDRRTFLGFLSGVSAAGILGLSEGRQALEGSERDQSATQGTTPTTTASSSQPATPARDGGSAMSDPEPAGELPAEEDVEFEIQDIQEISVEDSQATVDVLVSISNNGDVAVSQLEGYFTVSLNDEEVTTTSISFAGVPAGETLERTVTLAIQFDNIEDSLVTAVVLQSFELGLSGGLESGDFDKDVGATIDFSG